ncbi:MAG: cation:proton antiporter [Bythopirellula sp.]|nr:cation:proton antiporter [Bythopirellula sp.]
MSPARLRWIRETASDVEYVGLSVLGWCFRLLPSGIDATPRENSVHNLEAGQLTVMLLSLGLLIGMARLLGELARALHQPAVLGELLAGVLLGPTVFGTLAPEWQGYLFPTDGPNSIVLHGISTLAIVLFLLVAGLEVDLSIVWKQGRTAIKVGLAGIVIPFTLGILGAWLIPRALGRQDDADPLIFALFLGTAMAISALPVIVKTMMDLNLYRTDLGMIVVSAAIFDDLTGWTIFAIIMGMIGAQSGGGLSILLTVLLTLLYAGLMLTVGRWLFHRILPFLQAYAHWPAGVLGFIVSLGLFGAAFTEFIGIHAIFGAFIVGVSIGASPHLHERTRMALEEFVSFIFAPVFFASIGLRVNFLTQFDLQLVLTIFVLACLGKLLGGVLGARWGGLPTRDRWAIGFAMNARGAMEIILGLLALEAGIIRQPLFVALVVMAIVTSAISGPLMRWVLQQRQPHKLLRMLSPKLYQPDMLATTRREAIQELAALAHQYHDIDIEAVETLAWQREEIAATGIGNGVAIPHARLAGLKEAIVVVGISEPGINFDAPDGQLAHVLFLLLTPREDPTVQLGLSANIAQTFRNPDSLQQVLRAGNFTELLAALKILESR